MSEFETILEQLRSGEIDSEDAAKRLEKFGSSALMKRALDKEALEAENAELTAEIAQQQKAAKIEPALRDAGVDFQALRVTERQAIEGLEFEGNEPSEEWVVSTVSNLGLPMKKSGQ